MRIPSILYLLAIISITLGDIVNIDSWFTPDSYIPILRVHASYTIVSYSLKSTKTKFKMCWGTDPHNIETCDGELATSVFASVYHFFGGDTTLFLITGGWVERVHVTGTIDIGTIDGLGAEVSADADPADIVTGKDNGDVWIQITILAAIIGLAYLISLSCLAYFLGRCCEQRYNRKEILRLTNEVAAMWSDENDQPQVNTNPPIQSASSNRPTPSTSRTKATQLISLPPQSNQSNSTRNQMPLSSHMPALLDVMTINQVEAPFPDHQQERRTRSPSMDSADFDSPPPAIPIEKPTGKPTGKPTDDFDCTPECGTDSNHEDFDISEITPPSGPAPTPEDK